MYFLFALVGALVLTAFVSANPVPSVDLYHVERAIFDGNQTGPFRGDPNADKYCVYGGVNSEEGYKDAEWVEIFIKRWDPNWDDKDTGQCAKDLFSDLQATCFCYVTNYDCDIIKSPGGEQGVKVKFFFTHLENHPWNKAHDKRPGSIERAFRWASTFNEAYGDTDTITCYRKEDDPLPPQLD